MWIKSFVDEYAPASRPMGEAMANGGPNILARRLMHKVWGEGT